MRAPRTTLALLLVGLLLLAGCGGAGGASDSGSEGVSLTIWADDKYSRAIRESAARWGELNDVQVNVQAVSKDLQTVYVTAAQAGKGPDLVMGAHDWIGNLVQNGTIDPLQLTDDTRAAFNQLAIKGVTFNGQIYGIPYAIENVVLFRNTDEAPAHTEITGTRFVASFAPRSRVRTGDQIEVVVDTERIHFFDPETGNAIRG
jgi:arabinogalactan oligomer / maltooligosaccharide transport system substrate-binding protein